MLNGSMNVREVKVHSCLQANRVSDRKVSTSQNVYVASDCTWIHIGGSEDLVAADTQKLSA
jgi:hypothetical protein